MPTVKFDADTTALETKIAGISNSTQQVGAAIEQKRLNLLSIYSHFTTMSNIIAHQIQKNLAGTSAAAAANVWLNVAQIGTTTASIAQTMALASTYITVNPAMAAFLYSQGGLMSYNLVQQQINKAEAEEAQRRIAAVRESFERWS